MLKRARARNQRIKRYAFEKQLSPAEWEKINHTPALFNRLWRQMLKLSPSDEPPPLEFRK